MVSGQECVQLVALKFLKEEEPKDENGYLFNFFMKLYSFPKQERLLNRKDFVNLNRRGKRFHTRHFIVIIKETETGINRLGITVSKKIGNAVKRNRVKRLVREFFRLNKYHISTGCDIVIIGKRNSFLLNYTDTKKELGEIILGKGSDF